MRIKLEPVASIKPYPGNPRTGHDIDRIMRSISDHGFRQPIVVDADHVVIVGHGRLEAARQLGLKKIPVHVAADLHPALARAYRIADNRTAEGAVWDPDLLRIELEALLESEIDAEASGYGIDEIKSLLDGENAWGHNIEAEGPGGEFDVSESWPVIKIKVPPELRDRWQEHVRASGREEHEAFADLLH